MREEASLDRISALLEERGRDWGDATATHTRIAKVWSGILNVDVNAHQVALMMTGLKLVRAGINPDNKDSYDDGHGYLKIAQSIVEDVTTEKTTKEIWDTP